MRFLFSEEEYVVYEFVEGEYIEDWAESFPEAVKKSWSTFWSNVLSSTR